ncbi:MAG: 23S rRNA (adenine(2503)-C(2))-methyltransferase RlmN [Cyanobacteria bacterium SIG30]|nr:23S rRNA (adenine(2503)-C(2))-methyltransferase RlmN [Cyanobacteria bacterium SIG30]
MKSLSNFTLEELENLALELEEPKFRAKQLHNWIWTKSAQNFDEMTDLSKNFKEKLQQIAVVTNVKIKTKQVSSDGTIKYLLEYEDGECVETVLMRFDNRSNLTACVSSQVGCACGCDFCATGKRGFIRNLTAFEIANQILTIQRDSKLKVTNVVFMGQGEPLNNFENLNLAIKIINDYLQIGIRRITVSTCGIIPKIYDLTKQSLIPTLALSLHAPNHSLREKIMPIEKKHNLDELKKALKFFNDKTGDRITIEYVLLGNLNDTREMAFELAKFLKDIKCNINLIPYNSVDETKYKKPDKKNVMMFKYILEGSGKKVTVRLERGADIDAACGQLRGKVVNN